MNKSSADVFNWQSTINETYQELSQQIINYMPTIAGAFILLIVGYFTARLLSLAAKKLIQGLDSLFKRVAKNDSFKREQMKQSYALVVGKSVFWAVLIFFIAASANLLGWKMFSGFMSDLLAVLPSLVSGLVIILAGFLVSNLAKSGVMSAGIGAGLAQSGLLARAAQLIVLFSFIIIGVEQIGLNVQFLTSAIVVALGVVLAGAALAFSLGAKTMVANIIGAQHIRKHCRVGEHMKIGMLEGDILDVTQTAIVIDTDEGRAIIPAKYFNEEITLLNLESATVKKP